jgi:hypothetical protein
VISLKGALVLSAAVLAAPGAQAPSPVDRETAYWATVDTYIHGDREKALAEVAVWSGDDLDRIASSVTAKARAAERCAACPERSGFETLPLRAAVLLHGDRDRVDRMIAAREKGGAAACSIGAHGVMAGGLARWAAAQSGGREFAARFFHAMSLHYRAALCVISAKVLAENGLKLSPRDAGLHLALGLVHETNGSIGHTIVTSERVSRSELLKRARDEFEKALEIDPRLGEARLRLGRVWWRLGRPAEARAALQEAVAGEQGPALYLAHLFLGQVLEEMQDLEGAVEAYAAAVSLQPGAQAGGVALSHALILRGEADRAQEVLARVLAVTGRREASDPFVNYLFGTSLVPETILDRLKTEVAR